MKNTICLLFLSSTIFGMPVLSEYDKWGIITDNRVTRDGINDTYTINIQKWNSVTGNYQEVITLLQAEQSDFNTENDWKKDRIDINKSFYDSINGQMHFKSSTSNNKFIYDIKNNSFTTSTYERDRSESDYQINFDIPSVNGNSDGSFDVEIGGNTILKKNLDGSVQIGDDVNDIDITAEGLSIDGEPLISKKANGELHIGKNSWITKEENGRQKVWAKDAAGNSIPIDYTNGTKLLINGRDVEQSINNVGALSAALTGLPTVPKDTTLACGLGTGTHGGDFAFSGGCASQVNEKLSFNYAASMTMPGQDYAGKFEDKFSARAGFVWKLGKSVKPTQISMKDKQKLTNEITDLKSENKNLNEKITKFEIEKLELLARLERLEKIALSETNSQDLATIKLP